MLDIRLVRDDVEAVKAGLARRGEDTAPVDRLAELDRRQRELGVERDELRRRVKELSKEVGRRRRDGEDAADLEDESRSLGEQEKKLGAEGEAVATEVRTALLELPNLPADDAPDGSSPEDNVVLRQEGPAPEGYADHQRVTHWDIGDELEILDVERAVKMSGAMFVMYRGVGAALVRALCQAALDRNADAYEEVRPPSLVRTDTMVSTGHLPKFADDAYHVERDDLWLIPTAEVPLTSLARDEVLDEAALPKRLTAHTSCYRREAGSAGRDTRGLLRVHEFDKVEILAYATPEQAPAMHDEILQRAEGLLAELGLTYRIVDLCAGDLSGAAARTWDIEVYAPGVGQWLEASSVSWFGDYQARRANIRYRPGDGSRPRLVHTLNGSALAVPRVWAALVESHRQADGSVALPEVLHPYLRGATAIPPNSRP